MTFLKKINIDNRLIIIVGLFLIIYYLYNYNNEPFKDNEDDNKELKFKLFNCKKKLKSCTRINSNTTWDDIKNMKNKATIQYYLDECNKILTKNNC